MKITRYLRRFEASEDVLITEVGRLDLGKDEQVLLSNGEDIPFEVCAKEWGYYIGGSLGERMKSYGKKIFLCRNSKEQKYLLLVNKDQMQLFLEYLEFNEMTVISQL